MSIRKVNIADKHALFSEAWTPKVVGDVNGVQIKVVKLRGEFVWHKHDVEDELFLVTKGVLCMRFRDHEERIREGEFIIVPHGTEHCPVAEIGEVHVLLVEPNTTLNTGDTDDPRRRDVLDRV